MGKTLVSKEAWLRFGLQEFSRSGPQGLKIENMARMLGTNKSGFYWYFGGRNEFIREMLEFWRESETRALITKADEADTVVAKILRLFHLALEMRHSSGLLFQLRTHAARDPLFAKVLRATEQERQNYFRRLLKKLGPTKYPAQQTAEIVYLYYLGWCDRSQGKSLSKRDVHKQLQILSRLVGVDLSKV
ncbi:MAG: hypothetical protein A2X86_14480 [Bdellovibrionales bacterium GWA2_49_15]|nr:MAG: hypothetical protein A2X86_14480 [Bdellovibrionales bacterium GWA2_49_15]HAZ13825.1 hypothetical protein [Bdellovibrionales bacterium]